MQCCIRLRPIFSCLLEGAVLTPPPAHFCAWVYGTQEKRARKVLQYFASHLLNDRLWLVYPSIDCHASHDPTWSQCRPVPLDCTLVLHDALHWLGVACAFATCSPMRSCRLSRHLPDHTTVRPCKFTGSLVCSVALRH